MTETSCEDLQLIAPLALECDRSRARPVELILEYSA